MTPHITATQEQLERLNHMVRQLPPLPHLNIRAFTRSYTLRNNVYQVFSGYSNPFLHTTLRILKVIDPEMDAMLRELFNIKDRGGTERNDPLRTDKQIGLAYFPKGLTDFAPQNKPYNDRDTAVMRRALLSENAKDPECPTSDKAVTLKIYETPEYLHIYFNKYSPQTVKRIIILAMELAYNKLIPDTVKEKYMINGLSCLDSIMHNIYQPTTDSAELILSHLEEIVKQILKELNKNLVEDFAEAMQKNLNHNRKSQLDNAKRNAESYYSAALSQLTRYSNELKNANQALANYTEVDYTAIKILLEKIKNHPNTKLFTKNASHNLKFIIEEPLLFTEDKVWSRYISNNTSTTRMYIKEFARRYDRKYNTTPEILDFCIQRLFKEVLVDQKIKLFTSSLMYFRQTDTSFNIYKDRLPENSNLFPHPHLGTDSMTCWGDSIREITNAIHQDDGERAFLQLLYAFQQMSATDTTISNILTRALLNTRYHKCTVFQKGKNTERTTFENIIKEFIEHETNKINAPDDSSSETSLPF